MKNSIKISDYRPTSRVGSILFFQNPLDGLLPKLPKVADRNS